MKKLLVFVLALTLLLTVFTSCDNKPATVYKVTYDGNGSTSGTAPAESSAVEGKSVLVRNEGSLEKSGYGFTGWNTSSDGSGKKYIAGDEIALSSDLTLYAEWAVSYNSVVFNPKNGDELYIEKVKVGDAVKAPTVPVKTGCEFQGWTLDGKDYDFSKVVEKSIVLVAKWKQISCTVTFKTDGSAVGSQTVDYGKTITEPTTAKEGAVFKGWLHDGKVWDFSSPVTENMTLVAEWNNDMYQVTFYTGTDVTIKSQTIAYGNKAEEPTETLTREGYAFAGWTLDGEVYDFNQTVTRSMVLVAKWNIFCTVTFLDSDGETAVCPLQEVEYMTKAKEPEAPTKKGYTFSHWIAPDRSSYNFERPVYTSMDLISSWTPNEYTVSYDVNGGTTYGDNALPASSKYTYGDAITIQGISSSKVYKKGCILEGWTLNADGTGEVYKTGDTVVGEPDNMVLYAKWTDKNYQVGDIGPTGGVIIAVSENSLNSFKYVEAAPEMLSSMGCYGYYRVLTQTLDVKNTAVGCDGDDIGDGKTNTTALIGKMGDSACLEESSRTVYVGGGTTKSYDITGDYAAHMCRNHKVEKEGITYDDWYLPCIWEMWEFYGAVYKATGNGVPTGRYITSTEAVCDDYDKDGETKCWTVVFVTEGEGSKGVREKNEDSKGLNGKIWPVRYI